jgi:DNA-binding MurR/RpiR family transcriptional regulator
MEAQQIEFAHLVSQNYSNLTKSEKRIANFLRKNQDDAAFLSAAEIADRLGISEATVVRFARTLGFASYPALRVELQNNFRHRITHSARLRSRLDELGNSGDILERVTASEIDYMTQALNTIDRRELQRAVDTILERQKIYVFGLGPSLSLVTLLEIRLRRFGKDVVALRNAGSDVLDLLMGITRDDLLFVICFFDLNPTLQLVLDYAGEVGCPVIMLTDTLESIIGEKADVILAARRGPVSEFHSLVVPMTVINSILLAVAQADKDQVMAKLDTLDQLRERLKQLNQSF